jgi:hypothetical protein
LGQPGRFYETETTYFFEFGVTAADKGPVDDADSETQDDATPVAPKGKKKPAAKAKTAAKAKPKASFRNL